MKKLTSIFFFGLSWCNVGFAETAKEVAQKSLGYRLYFALESLIFGLIFCAIAFVFVKIVKTLFKKDIAYKDIYIHAFFAGVIIRAVILVLLK